MTVLDDIKVECMQYVATHYVPWDEDRDDYDESYAWSDSDEEATWDRALDATLGPWELWDLFYAGRLTDDELRSQFAGHLERVAEAFAELVEMVQSNVSDALRRRTPEWWAFWALDTGLKRAEEHPDRVNIREVVGNYLYNMSGGLMDATAAFYDFDEGLDEEDDQ